MGSSTASPVTQSWQYRRIPLHPVIKQKICVGTVLGSWFTIVTFANDDSGRRMINQGILSEYCLVLVVVKMVTWVR